MDILAVTGGVVEELIILFVEAGGEVGGAEAGAEPGFQVNLFWIIAQATSFLLFLGILYLAAFRRIGGVLEERRTRIEQGLRDADAARREREQAASEKQTLLNEARREANEIVGRAQRSADEVRERELATTRSEIERLRDQATSEIQAERDRTLAAVRGEVADLALAAASRVVRETMNEPRERRLVEEFLATAGRPEASR